MLPVCCGKWAEKTIQWTGGLNLYRRIASAYPGASPNSARLKFTQSCLKIVTGQLLSNVDCFSSEVSFCRSPGFHLSIMVADWCWDHGHSEFGFEGVKTQCQCTLTSWPTSIYEIDHQDILKSSARYPKFHYAIVPKYHISDSSLTSCTGRHIGTVLSWKWGPSQYYDALLTTGCHSVLLLGQKLNSQIRMLVNSFYCFRKSSILMCLRCGALDNNP